jgi:hypothetical protein
MGAVSRMMKPLIFSLCAVLILTVLTVPVLAQQRNSAPSAPAPQQSPQPAPTIASIVVREISALEKEIVGAAEAMPEDKFNFSPESLNSPGSDYSGVRTFAVEIKHVAASNYFLWSPVTGGMVADWLTDENGPESMKTKADIINFLKVPSPWVTRLRLA